MAHKILSQLDDEQVAYTVKIGNSGYEYDVLHHDMHGIALCKCESGDAQVWYPWTAFTGGLHIVLD